MSKKYEELLKEEIIQEVTAGMKRALAGKLSSPTARKILSAKNVRQKAFDASTAKTDEHLKNLAGQNAKRNQKKVGSENDIIAKRTNPLLNPYRSATTNPYPDVRSKARAEILKGVNKKSQKTGFKKLSQKASTMKSEGFDYRAFILDEE